MLYLVKSNDSYKVGFTDNIGTLNSRISQYATHNPNTEFIGVREGTKEDEKRYYNILGLSGTRVDRAEWFKNPNIDEIMNDFTIDGNIISLFGSDLKYSFGEIDEEMYSELQFRVNGHLFMVGIVKNSIYLFSGYSKMVYDLGIKDFKLFSKGYNKGNSPDKLRGIILKDRVILQRQEPQTPPVDTIYIYNIENTQYSDIIDQVKDFIWHTSEIEEINPEMSEVPEEYQWIVEKLKDGGSTEYSFQQLKDIFQQDFYKNFTGHTISTYFPEHTKKRKTVNKIKETYYNFNI